MTDNIYTYDWLVENKYAKWYSAIIKNAFTRNIIGYSEKHHIRPKSLGGSNNKDNIVILTAREHFLCHLLLTKCLTGSDRQKMIHAFFMLRAVGPNQKRYISSNFYAALKEEFSKSISEIQSGKNNSQYGKVWVFNNDLKKSQKIDSSDLEQFLSEGWIKGRKLNFSKKAKKVKPSPALTDLYPVHLYSQIKIASKLLNRPKDLITYADISSAKILLQKLIHEDNLSPSQINSQYNLGFKGFHCSIPRSWNIKLKTQKEGFKNFLG